jgi:hypothetical protein
LQFAKAGSAATLSQQEKNTLEDVQRESKYYRVYLSRSTLAFSAMYLR